MIYIIRNRLNGKIYVGKTTRGSVEQRWKEHLRDARKGANFALYRAIRKYGPEAFSLHLLSSYAISLVDLNEQERHFIAKYRAYPPSRGYGYNETPGGDGVDMNPDVRAKIRAAQLKFYSNPEAHTKLSLALRNRVLTEEGRKNILRSVRRSRSLQARKRMSVSAKIRVTNSKRDSTGRFA